jgi:hypothetical protein
MPDQRTLDEARPHVAAPVVPAQVTSAVLRLHEALLAWAVVAALTLAVFVTYSRFPVSEFYNVSKSGLEGGAGRALVYLNFPVAFIAVALGGFAFARLWATYAANSTVRKLALSAVYLTSIGLSLVAVFVVKQSDLDAKPANVIPALGVAIAIGLTVWALRSGGLGAGMTWTGLDTGGAIFAGILLIMSVPWIFADLGIYVDDIPLLERVYMSKEIVEGHTMAAVHLGDHHGFNGTIFALTALVLARAVWQIGQNWLRLAMTAYLAFMFVYGVTNMLQDFWGEQIVKRGWLDASFPSVVLPKLSLPWLLMLLATVVVATSFALLTRPSRSEPAGQAGLRVSQGASMSGS